MSYRKFLGVTVVGLAVASGSMSACGASTRPPSGFEPDSSLPDAQTFEETSTGEGGPLLIPDDAKARNDCPEGNETRITGKVYDPAGRNPLYNVQVFVPSGPLPEIKGGAQCVTCDSEVLNPVAAALTNVKGEFELKSPKLLPGKDVPLVIQVGKWRRKFVIPEVKACEANPLKDKDIRLPKNGQEGDMPQIAVTSGGCDALECLLAGIGIDPAEFEAGEDPAVPGHIHVFKGSGGGTLVNGKNVPEASTVWNNPTELAKFDIVMLSCECSENNTTKTYLNAMRDYANLGGRVFATHFHYTWIKNNQFSEWKEGLLNFTGNGSGGGGAYPVNTSFPKGKALAEWLVEVRASSRLGEVNLTDVTTSFNGLANASPAQDWIGTGPRTKYVTFNTPLSEPVAKQCGRFVYSDVHSAGSGAGNFPSSSCRALNEQQTALEFLFFDLSSCVQDDKVEPGPPR